MGGSAQQGGRGVEDRQSTHKIKVACPDFELDVTYELFEQKYRLYLLWHVTITASGRGVQAIKRSRNNPVVIPFRSVDETPPCITDQSLI